ncbi:MAG: type II secretion system protein, partial [Planctomycetes bacterium]|nr:type II secretion system protein [Planctomycetota bacterium]
MNPPKRQSMLRAFTLIELLVVMVIIASLSAMILPYLHHGDRIAHEEKTKAGMNIISTAIETYKSHVGVLPLSQWNINDPQPEWSPNNPYDTTNIWDPSNYLGDDPFAFNQSNRLLWRMSSRMDSAQKKKVKDAVEAAVLEVEMKIAPGGGGWEEFGVINYSTNYTTLLDEKRDWCESVPEINILRKRFDRTGDTYARNGDGSPVIISELATDDPSWHFKWGGCAGGAMTAAWTYYSMQAKEDAKRLDYIMDVLDSSSIDEEMISDDGESILDAWGNPIIYIERDYRPMPLTGVFPPWSS